MIVTGVLASVLCSSLALKHYYLHYKVTLWTIARTTLHSLALGLGNQKLLFSLINEPFSVFF